jgi:DNA-3-methyladenine glycosylase
VSKSTQLGVDFFARSVGRVANDLVGCTLLVGGVGGPIVEVERYQEDDPASHSFRGPRGRAVTMFGPPGCLYVYRSYGIHWCLNIVCEGPGRGAAVLIRAIEPVVGIEAMRERRPGRPDRELCSGPGRLCQALGVDGEFDGQALGDRVTVLPRSGRVSVVRGPRIGISVAIDRPWRFGALGSAYLSRPMPATPEAHDHV